jgi:hypothetical protein
MLAKCIKRSALRFRLKSIMHFIIHELFGQGKDLNSLQMTCRGIVVFSFALILIRISGLTILRKTIHGNQKAILFMMVLLIVSTIKKYIVLR